MIEKLNEIPKDTKFNRESLPGFRAYVNENDDGEKYLKVYMPIFQKPIYFIPNQYKESDDDKRPDLWDRRVVAWLDKQDNGYYTLSLALNLPREHGARRVILYDEQAPRPDPKPRSDEEE